MTLPGIAFGAPALSLSDVPSWALERGAVSIDGRDLWAYGAALESLSVGDAAPVTSMADVPGADGAADLTLEAGGRALLSRRAVECGLVAFGDAQEVVDARRRLGALSGREVELWLAPYGCAFRGRASLGAWEDSLTGCRVTLSLDAEPVGYGRARSVALRSGNNALLVGGNERTWPVVTLTPPSGAKYARVALGGLYVQVPGTFDGKRQAVVDMGQGLCRVGGSLASPTIESDYFALPPGRQALSCSCPGAVEWRERWLV